MQKFIYENFLLLLFVLAAIIASIGGGKLIGKYAFRYKIKTEGVATYGRVKALQYDEDGNMSPIIIFSGRSGSNFEYYAHNYTSMPWFIGQDVKLWYMPNDDSEKVIYERPMEFIADLQRWVLFGVLGLIGYGGLGLLGFRRMKRLLVQFNGMPLQTLYLGSIDDFSKTVNNRTPQRVHTKYTDPVSGQCYHFYSPPLWNEPRALIEPGDVIEVKVDPRDYGRYAMDLSFLNR